MEKRTWSLLGIALVIGLIIGFAVATVADSEDESESDGGGAQINNVELKVGDIAPDFRLPDHKGGFVRLSDYRGKSNVVIAFYPAAFTPV